VLSACAPEGRWGVAQELADTKEAYACLSRDAITRHGLIGAIFHAPPSVLDRMADVLQPEQPGSSALSRAGARSRSPGPRGGVQAMKL
jgi:hypothetical protein